MKLNELRFYYPEYDDMEDAELAAALYDKYYSGQMDRPAFDAAIGFEVQPFPQEPQPVAIAEQPSDQAPAGPPPPTSMQPADPSLLTLEDPTANQAPEVPERTVQAHPLVPFELAQAHAPYLAKFMDRRGALSPDSFDPEGPGYDYASARGADIKPDPSGHWPSRDPRSGLILKEVVSDRDKRLLEHDQALQARMRGYDPGAGAGGARAAAMVATMPIAATVGGVAAGLRLIVEQDLEAAGETLNEVMSQPANFLYKKVEDPETGATKFEASNIQDERLAGEILKPFELVHKAGQFAGDWAMEAAGESDQAAEVGATVATLTEAVLLLGLPRLAGVIAKSNWMHRLTNRERALTVSDITNMKKSGMSEGQIIRELRKMGDNKPFQDALKARQTPEPRADKPAAARQNKKQVKSGEEQKTVVPAESANVFNKSDPGHQIKYDGEFDRSAINKPPMYQFTAYDGPAKGASFNVESPTPEMIRTGLQRMIEVRQKAKQKKVAREPEQKTLPPPETLKAKLDRLAKEAETRKERARQLAQESKGRAIVLTPRDASKRGVVIHKSTKKVGEFQVSYWDDRGFSGDHTEPTLEKAIKSALDEGYEYVNPSAFEKTTGSIKFFAYTKATELMHKNFMGGEKGEGIIELGSGKEPPQKDIKAKHFYDDKAKKYVTVKPGPSGNYTFYKSETLNASDRGQRIRMRPAQWFKTEAEAQAALVEYAKKRKFSAVEAPKLDPEKAGPIFQQPEGTPEPTITGKGKDKTVKVEMPKAEADQLTAKEQKEYLLSEINTAFKAAKKELDYRKTIKGKPGHMDTYEYTDPGKVVIEVPGDGKFTIKNTKEALAAFKKLVSSPQHGMPSEKGPTFKLPQPKAPKKPTGRRISSDGVVEYYNEFQPTKGKVVESEQQDYRDGFFVSGPYMVKMAKPKLKKPITGIRGLGEKVVLSDWAQERFTKKHEPAEIVGQFAAGEFVSGQPMVHLRTESGTNQAANAKYVDHILSVHPNAQPHIAGPEELIVFTDKAGKVVGVLGGIKPNKNEPVLPGIANKRYRDIYGKDAGAGSAPADVPEMPDNRVDIHRAWIDMQGEIRATEKSAEATAKAEWRELMEHMTKTTKRKTPIPRDPKDPKTPKWARNEFERLLESALAPDKKRLDALKKASDKFAREYEKRTKEKVAKKKAPSGMASEGGFNTAAQESPRAKPKAKTDSRHRGGYADQSDYIARVPFVMQMPELVRIARKLMDGKLPQVAKKISRNPDVRGFFRPAGRGQIKLKSELMDDVRQALAVLAHEIGHLADWLPHKDLARGNLLGRMASLQRFGKHWLPFKPGAPGPLTDADRARLMAELKQKVSLEKPKYIDEVIKKEIPLEPREILAIWNNAADDIKKNNPELYRYIAGLSSAEKKLIVKEALKGQVPEELKRFSSWIEEPTGRKIKVPGTASKEEIQKRYKKLIEEEIKKRKLFSEEDIRRELIEWTHFWKPFDPMESMSYTRYRYSGVELYADFFSGVMLAPETVKQYTPKSYEAFFNYLERKPKLLEEYNKIQDEIKAGTVDSQLTKDIRAGFRRGDQKWFLQYQKNVGTYDLIMRDLVDMHHFLLQKVRDVGERNVPPGENPRYRIEELRYAGSEHEVLILDVFRNVVKPLEKAGADWEEFGEYLLHLRVVHERDKMFNPLGAVKERSVPRIKELEEGPTGQALRDAYQALRDIHLEVIETAERAEIWSPEMIEMMREREFYARFLVVDYLEQKNGRGPGAHVYRQYGTLNEITNPATATIMQDMSVLRSTTRNIAARTTIDFLNKHFPDEVFEPKKRWVTNHHEFVEPTNRDLKLLTYMKNGKIEGKYINKYIAESFEANPIESMILGRLFSATAKPFRMLFTELNYGFWMFNMRRDYMRAVKNLKGATGLNFLKYYKRGIRPALRSVFGIPDPVAREVLQGNMLLSIADIRGMVKEDQQIERLMKQFHMKPREFKLRFIRPFGKLFTYFTNIGRAVERTPKIASYLYLREKFPQMSKEEIGHIVRTQGGSPDFLRAGRAYPIYNNLLLFSNAMKEGYRGDWEAFSKTPGEYLWKTAKYNWIPKALMRAGAAGLLGVGIKKIYDAASEYDKTNFTIIPIGIYEPYDPDEPEKDRFNYFWDVDKEMPTAKAVYLRVPTDETGRLFGGIMWKLMNYKDFDFADSSTQLFDYMAGQAPTVNPAFDVLVDIVQYASGRNPYNSYRGQLAIPESIHTAGGERAHKYMAEYIANKLGSGIVYRFKSGDIDTIKTELEEIIGYPISSNILGRFLKVSDYGVREDIRVARKAAAKTRMKEVLAARDAISKMINGVPLTEEDQAAVEKRPDVLGDENLIRGLARKHGWLYLEEYISANTTEEREAVVRILMEKEGLLNAREPEKKKK